MKNNSFKMENYILITSTNPFEAQMSSTFYLPERTKSELAIKLKYSIAPVLEDRTKILYDLIEFEFLDKDANSTSLQLKHLHVSLIKYNYETNNITFVISDGLLNFGHQYSFKRTTFEIREDIVRALQHISTVALENMGMPESKIEENHA